MAEIDNNLMDNKSGSNNNSNKSDIVAIVFGTIAAISAGIAGYFIGNNNGYKKGFKDASKIYEKKLKKQTEAFLNKKKDLEANLAEYNELLEAYESYIDDLEERLAQGEAVGNVIDFLKAKEDELENLRDA